ncbi:PPOX class F420-dependent oxidoreductase [Pseudokineococcus sp. 1T1Z-3]|uniref:PPOX class F420-dependent oxidoreductase n=1 Tax=Pseudokineococcus sp. 1T1Z-3 TaxID=3132745 RepID=UPI0030B00168
MDTTPSEAFWRIGDGRFALLTTFRRSGVGVATTVWLARDGGRLVVTTPGASAKVKRLRRDARVLLAPCGRLGRVAPGAPVVEARGRVLGPDGEHPGAVAALAAKYGVAFRVVLTLEAAMRRRRGGDTARVVVALEPAGSTQR